MELTTRQNYTYSLNRHIMPTFAEFRMIDILPADVREWVAKLQVGGVQPPTIRYAMTVLSAIFTTALNDQITFLHPCMGVKTPTVATKRRRILTPDQFGALYDAIGTREPQPARPVRHHHQSRDRPTQTRRRTPHSRGGDHPPHRHLR
jgi:site-specific recombinase XerD